MRHQFSDGPAGIAQGGNVIEGGNATTRLPRPRGQMRPVDILMGSGVGSVRKLVAVGERAEVNTHSTTLRYTQYLRQNFPCMALQSMIFQNRKLSGSTSFTCLVA